MILRGVTLTLDSMPVNFLGSYCTPVIVKVSSSLVIDITRNCINCKSGLLIAQTCCGSTLSKGLSTVMTHPFTATIARVSVASAPLISSVSPTFATTSRSSVTASLAVLIADTRPPLARPAKISSDILMISPTCGIKPSKPVLNDTCCVSNCSESNAHCPTRYAWACDVQPNAEISS